MPKHYSILILVSLAFLLFGCSGASPSVTTATGTMPRQIKEPQLGAPAVIQTVQRVRTSNCDGLNPKTTVSRSLQQGQGTSFEVQVEAGGLVKGTPIPLVLEAEIEARVRGALARITNTTLQDSISLNLQMDQGKEYDHTITWNETRVKGIIELVYPDAIARLAFERVIGLELAGRISNPNGCIGQTSSTINPISTILPVQPTYTPLPTLTLYPTVPLPTARPTSPSFTPTVVQVMPAIQPHGYCYGNCWDYDDSARTMTWRYIADGNEDVWQPPGDAIQKIRNGYTAIFQTSVPGEIYACILTVNGSIAKTSCDQVLYKVPIGKYQMTSANKDIGGFRWCPEAGYGWRTQGGTCG